MTTQTESVAAFRADMARMRRRRNRGTTKVTVTFHISDETRRKITDWLPEGSPLNRRELATVEAIQDWLLERVLGEVDDVVRIAECIELDCYDTDDDHDHADGPKVVHEAWCNMELGAPCTCSMDDVR